MSKWSWDGEFPIKVRDEDGFVICEMPPSAETFGFVHKVLAAPELLSALKMARTLLVEIEGYDPEGASVRAIDAAIAKANGEQA